MKPTFHYSSHTPRPLRALTAALGVLASLAAAGIDSAQAGTVLIPGSGTAAGGAAVVVGGSGNNANAFASGIFTGFNHTNNGVASAILTGINNVITARNSYIGCGNNHVLGGPGASTILSGIGNTVSATGDSAAVLNGTSNTVGGTNSVAAGFGVNSVSNNSFTFGTNVGLDASAVGFVALGDSDPAGVPEGTRATIGNINLNVGGLGTDTLSAIFHGGYVFSTDNNQLLGAPGPFNGLAIQNPGGFTTPAFLGVNKLNPTVALDVNGALSVSGNTFLTSPFINLGANSGNSKTGVNQVYNNVSLNVRQASPATDIMFRVENTAGLSSLQVQSNGDTQFGVDTGTASIGINAAPIADVALQVAAAAGDTIIAGFRNSSGTSIFAVANNNSAPAGNTFSSSGNGLINGAVILTSDRNAKKDFAPVVPREILDKLVAIPVTTWKFKQDEAQTHMGPMAQDFRAAFGLGYDEKHITTVDADGVALAAIQGLNEKLEGELTAKEKRIDDLESRLGRLEKLIEKAAE